MCGIAGIIRPNGRGSLIPSLHALTEALAHRGPDDGGVIAFDTEGERLTAADHERAVVGLGHRRLSIVDIAFGHQPLRNESGSVWVVFNGEIYNFRGLRRELEERGHRFSTNSDTEVLVHGWEEWRQELLPRLNGVFAFALYDARARCVVLARDPVGAKPLYIGIGDGRTWWSSEIDAARRAGLVGGAIDPDAIKLFLMLRFIPSPWSPYRGVWKVPPSHYAVVRLEEAGTAPQLIRYDSAIRSSANPTSPGDWRDALADELPRAVSRQLMSDVSVGSLLSGGVDSSVITAIMARESAVPPQAFAIGFRGAAIADEADAARLAAREIGVPLTTVSVNESDYFAGWPDAARHLGEPIANSGVLLVGLLCAEVRKTHKVVLTGQGADEPLGGYPRHVIQRLAAIGRLAPTASAAVTQRLFGGDSGDRLRRALSSASFEDRAGAILAVVPPERVDAIFTDETTPTRDLFGDLLRIWRADIDDRDPTGSLLRIDMRMSLADDLLIVADHFSMQQSVELRVPFLDLEFLELVSRMPTRFKVSRIGRRKWLYRQAASRLLPRATARRLRGVRASFGRKVGFATPLDAWFASAPPVSGSRWLADHVDTSPSALAAALPSPRQRAAFHALDLWLDGR